MVSHLATLLFALAPNAQTNLAQSRRNAIAAAFTSAATLATQTLKPANAKAGQFGKIGIFGMEDISSPYVPGGPKAGPEATFGYAKSEGEFLAKGYESDVSREKAAFLESAKRIGSLQPKLDSKTWWFIRDELRIQAYVMRSSMRTLNGALADSSKPAAEKAYKTFWKEIEQFDLACRKKEPDLAQKEYGDVIAALKEYSALV